MTSFSSLTWQALDFFPRAKKRLLQRLHQLILHLVCRLRWRKGLRSQLTHRFYHIAIITILWPPPVVEWSEATNKQMKLNLPKKSMLSMMESHENTQCTATSRQRDVALQLPGSQNQLITHRTQNTNKSDPQWPHATTHSSQSIHCQCPVDSHQRPCGCMP